MMKRDAVDRASHTSSLSVGFAATQDFLLLVSDTKATRRKRLLTLLFVMCVPMIVLIVQCAVTMSTALSHKAAAHLTALAITSSVQVGEVVTRLQRERGMTSNSDPWNNLVRLRASSDDAIGTVGSWPGSAVDIPALQSPTALRETLDGHRIDRMAKGTSISELFWYADLIGHLLKLMNRDVRLSGDPQGKLWRFLFAYELFENAKESYGIQRAMGSTIFAKGIGAPIEYQTFDDNYFKSKTFMELCFMHSEQSLVLYNRLVQDQQPLVTLIAVMRGEILAKQKTAPSVATGLIWFGNMTTYIDLISGLETDLVQTIQSELDNQISSAQDNFIKALALLTLVAVLCPPLCVWYIKSVNTMNSTIHKAAKILASQTKTLSAEKRKGEKLLHRMLPPFIADALKRGDHVAAEHFEATTIYFSDIVGFTKISSRSTPLQVVEMLNSLYSKFDSELDAHDVYKMETIGDAYMVVSGVPRRNGDYHAREIASLAIDLLQRVNAFQIRHLPTEHLRLRIGLHTGPVLAGVVGRKMPRYCLFGNTVTRAEVMEQRGLPMKIHVSAECKALLDKMGGFELIARDREMEQSDLVGGPVGVISSTETDEPSTYWLKGKRLEGRFPD